MTRPYPIAAAFVMSLIMLACAGRPQRDEVAMIEHGGRSREYILSTPESYDGEAALPLVLYLHGGNGTAARSKESGGFEALAAREGIFVLYPQAVGRAWNVGFGDIEEREAAREAASVDDVGFIIALLDHVSAQVRVDPARIYVVGVSRGAMMTHRLLCERADRFAGAAPIIGGVPEPIWAGCEPARPVPLTVMQGTADPLVPYEGGDVTVFGSTGGPVIATEEAVARWREINGCDPAAPPAERVIDADPDDGITTRVLVWSRGCEAAPVELVRVEGGGHTWPGGAQYLPRRMIGAASRDLDAAEQLWSRWSALRAGARIEVHNSSSPD